MGLFDLRTFNSLFDCSDMVFKEGMINGCKLTNFWRESNKLEFCFPYDNSPFFKHGFALLLGVKECEIKNCKADGTISEIETENTRHGVFGDGKYVLLN